MQSRAAGQLRIVYHSARNGYSNLASERPMGTTDKEMFNNCSISSGGYSGKTNSSKLLECKVKVPRTMKPPILIYYGLGQFYQNFVTYIKSEVPKELAGKQVSESMREFKCRGKHTREKDGKQIVPCGSKATSLFTDRLEITGMTIDRTDVAWPSDVARYNNPSDYPQRPNTMWMKDMFPEIVDASLGVKTEAFATWMRPAALGRVWNNYGWLNEELKEGDELKLKINSHFETPDGSSKMFVLTQRNRLGGRHDGLAVAFMLCGCICFGMASMACFIKPKP